jgi:phosphoglycerate dehydrogenase-like enzyme
MPNVIKWPSSSELSISHLGWTIVNLSRFRRDELLNLIDIKKENLGRPWSACDHKYPLTVLKTALLPMTRSDKPKGLFILPSDSFDLIYGQEERESLGHLFEIPSFTIDPREINHYRNLMLEAEVIFSGWGAPRLDETFLSAVPRLRAFFYGSGGIKGIVTEAFWKRNIPICNAAGANAIPVSEFTLAQIILSLKRAWYFMHGVRESHRDGYSYPGAAAVVGTYHSTVGLVSMGMIGRMVREKLRTLDVQVLAYDPFLSPEEAVALDVEACSLEDIFSRSDVISLHTPWLPETEEIITGRLLESMKQGATFINTARGAIINEAEMIEVLQKRSDLYAILDVTYPEPPPKDSPLYSLPNVVLTPHIAGSVGQECRRMGKWMVEEAERFLLGQPLRWRLSEERLPILA